jgi:hypothetical protein
MSKKAHVFSHKHFAGSVELIPSQRFCVEFIDGERLWGFPIQHLADFTLEDDPEHQSKRTLPPQRLTLTFRRSHVILRGWRLELLVGPLVSGRVARIYAEKHLGALVIDEAWVSEIQVQPLAGACATKIGVEIPIKTRP